MKDILKTNRWFLIPQLILIVIGSIFLLIYTKPELHIIFNKANSYFFDVFFKYATNLGDGAIIPILFIVLLIKNYRFAFIFLSGSLLTSIIINLIKKVLLGDVFRPSKYFELYSNYQLHFVEGVKLHALQSFPSGHTGTAFNLFLMLALLVKNNLLKLLFLILATLVAYSRVYLSQHFLIDVVVGSIIGTCCMIFAWYLIGKSKKKWLDLSLIQQFKSKP